MPYYLITPFAQGDIHQRSIEGGIYLHDFECSAQRHTYSLDKPSLNALKPKADFQVLRFSKPLDKTSSVLFQHCTQGEMVDSIKIATLHSQESIRSIQEMTFYNVLFCEYSVSGKHGNLPSETICAWFDTLELCIRPLDETLKQQQAHQAKYHRS